MLNEQDLTKKCPYCGKKTFRRLDIYRNNIIWKCKSCMKTKREKLFPLRKKIIYVDQLVYSLILKSSKKNKGDKWHKLGEKIIQLVEDQIVVCPYSNIHRTETELYKTYSKEIVGLYRKLSQGISFKRSFHVEQHQLYHSLNNFLYENKTTPYETTWKHALSDNPNRWSQRFNVFSKVNIDVNEIKRLEALKVETAKKIQYHYNEIQKKEMITFEEDFDIEKTFLAEAILKNHIKNNELIRNLITDINPSNSLLNYLYDHVEWIIPQIKKFNKTGDNPSSVMKKFLSSEDFYNTPYVYIWAYLFAALNQKVRNSKRKAKEGDYFDITAISYYLPYCDLMIIDNEFRDLLEERGAPILKKFNTIVISGKTLDDLFEIFEDWISNSRVDEVRKVYKSLDRSSLF